MVMTLYKTDPSPPARAVMMVIDVLGIKVDERELNPVLREQDTPEFKKVNPMRTIPILNDGEYWLADSHAIMLYLFDKYAKPEHSHLYPSNKEKRGIINQRLFFDCGVLFPRLRAVMISAARISHIMGILKSANDEDILEKRRQAQQLRLLAPTYAGRLAELSKYMIRNIHDAYSILEAYLSDTLYLADDVVTLADLSIISTLSSLHGLVPVDDKRYPKLNQWLRNMNEKDYCKRINQPGSKIHVDGLIALMENTKFNQKSKL